MFPYYLFLGCSYKEFWEDSPYIARAYLDAEEYRRERVNYELWLQGLYFHNAVGSALAMAFWDKKHQKPEGYLKYPIAFTEREHEAEKQRRIEATLKFFRDGQNK